MSFLKVQSSAIRELYRTKKKWWGRKVLGPLGRPKKLVTDKVEYQESRWEGSILITFSWVKEMGHFLFLQNRNLSGVNIRYSQEATFFLKKIISNFFDLLRISKL
jgi:hypothetical protein